MTDENHHDPGKPKWGEQAPPDERNTPRAFRTEEQGQPYIAIDRANGESKTRVIIGDDVFVPLAELEAAQAQAAQDHMEADAYAAVMVERDQLKAALAEQHDSYAATEADNYAYLQELKLRAETAERKRNELRQEYLAILSYLRRINQPVIAMAIQQGRHKEAQP